MTLYKTFKSFTSLHCDTLTINIVEKYRVVPNFVEYFTKVLCNILDSAYITKDTNSIAPYSRVVNLNSTKSSSIIWTAENSKIKFTFKFSGNLNDDIYTYRLLFMILDKTTYNATSEYITLAQLYDVLDNTLELSKFVLDFTEK